MAYYVDLFSPETYEAFSQSNREVSGFSPRQEKAASRVTVGDKLVCYVTKLGRWVGILEVTSKYFRDDTPIFYSANDPFVIRFKVKVLAWLSKEKAIPIRDDRVWDTLSFTQGYDKSGSNWTGKLRHSLNALDDEDGQFLEQFVLSQERSTETFDIDERDFAKMMTHKVRRPDREVTVSVPQDPEPELDGLAAKSEVRESIRIQALLARIGSQMGLKIWIPRNDRSAVLREWNPDYQ